ncbi:MAG: RNA polymerase sigma factor [Limisphaerales bacterium]
MSAVVQDRESIAMDPEPKDELALLGQVADGDEQALAVLYERYADPLFGYIYHALGGAREETEEVWQDTLSSAFRAAGSFRGQSRLFSWLCSIARHKITDHRRRNGLREQNLSLMAPEDMVRLADGSPLPDEVVNQREVCLRVAEVLGHLPSGYRVALVARYAEGRSVEEIAQLLDKSYKATESTLTRAREAFRLAISSQWEAEI